MLKRVTVVFLGLLVLGACKGNRAKILEDASDQGSWRMDGTLIRQYDITLTQAYDSILQLAKDQEWRVTDRSSSPYGADIDAVADDGKLPIEFSVWAPANKAVEIGVKYAGGDRIESIRVFEQLDKFLPKKDDAAAK